MCLTNVIILLVYIHSLEYILLACFSDDDDGDDNDDDDDGNDE